MSNDDGQRDAAVAAALGTDEQHAALVQSVAAVARALFRAEAATIYVLDGQELVFATISGRGERDLLGRRISASTGLAGWALASREAVAVEDVSSDPRFSRETAEAAGYEPSALVTAPIVLVDRAVGVLQIVDPRLGRPVGPGDLSLLSLFADQAALALDLVQQKRPARPAAAGVDAAERLAAAVACHPNGERWTAVLDALSVAIQAG